MNLLKKLFINVELEKEIKFKFNNFKTFNKI